MAGSSVGSAIGDIKILEVQQDGKYIRLHNDGKQVRRHFIYIVLVCLCVDMCGCIIVLLKDTLSCLIFKSVFE